LSDLQKGFREKTTCQSIAASSYIDEMALKICIQMV